MLPDDPRRVEVLETLAELCLRLNGYFCMRNYLQHRPQPEKFELLTESDLLAMRLAHLLVDSFRRSCVSRFIRKLRISNVHGEPTSLLCWNRNGVINRLGFSEWRKTAPPFEHM